MPMSVVNFFERMPQTREGQPADGRQFFILISRESDARYTGGTVEVPLLVTVFRGRLRFRREP